MLQWGTLNRGREGKRRFLILELRVPRLREEPAGPRVPGSGGWERGRVREGLPGKGRDSPSTHPPKRGSMTGG